MSESPTVSIPDSELKRLKKAAACSAGLFNFLRWLNGFEQYEAQTNDNASHIIELSTLQSSRFAIQTKHQGRTLVLCAQPLEMRWLAAMPWEHAWLDRHHGRLYLHVGQVTALSIDLSKLTVGFNIHRRHLAALTKVDSIEFAGIKVQGGLPVSVPYGASNKALLPIKSLADNQGIVEALKLIAHRAGAGKLGSGDADINALI